MPTTQPQPHLWDGTPMAAMPYVISKGSDTPVQRVYEGMNMSEHTPGKLEVLDDRRISITLPPLIEDSGYSSHCVAMTYGGDERVNSHANARRLVACWNALEDLPQDALDGGWTRAGLEAYGLQMKAERDRLSAINAELLEALKGLMSVESRGRVMPIGKEWDSARAAIAKAQGEQ